MAYVNPLHKRGFALLSRLVRDGLALSVGVKPGRRGRGDAADDTAAEAWAALKDGTRACSGLWADTPEGYYAACRELAAIVRKRFRIRRPRVKGDFRFTNHGSLVTFQPVSRGARAWFTQHVQDGPMIGHYRVVEARYAPAILEGLRDAGFSPIR